MMADVLRFEQFWVSRMMANDLNWNAQVSTFWIAPRWSVSDCWD
jgi:hypothetical protein